MEKLLSELKEFESWQVALVIFVLGFVIFFTGLNGGFQGDDAFQIVNNTPVHSISNVGRLFQSGTFYNGHQLTGDYYRPLMSTTFSLIYTLFGPSPMAFHIVQLILYLTGAFVLYLIFRHFFMQLLALALVFIFIVHPLNSQDVFAIPSMQDALFFLFGSLSLWILMTYRSTRSMIVASASLLMALLSKEAAVIFVGLAFLYLFIFDRNRLYKFIKIMALPLLVYFALKANAVGLIGRHPKGGPIDNYGLFQRIYTMPSLVFFYASKFVFPSQIANNYYWVYPSFSIRHVLFPLIADSALIGMFIYYGVRVRQILFKEKYKTYLFFMAWTSFSLGIYLQILPLDMTACEGWFYFSMAGLLGAIGIIIQTYKFKLNPNYIALIVVILIGVLGVRTAIRGTNYRNQYTLAIHDVKVSKDDYFAMNNLSQTLIDRKQFKEAVPYAQQSISIYPATGNYDNLGVALEQIGDYAGAQKAYEQALKYGEMDIVYENLSLILMMYSSPTSTEQFFQKALSAYPHDFKLWVYFSLFEGAGGHESNAKVDVTNAAKYGSVPPVIYNNIMNNQPFALPLLGKTLVVQ